MAVWTHTYIVQGDTEKDARDFYNHYVHEHGDWEAATNLTEGLGINAQTVPPEALDFLREHFIAGWAGWPVIGTREQIVDTYVELADTGIDGVLTSWARYEEGMAGIRRRHLPADGRGGAEIGSAQNRPFAHRHRRRTLTDTGCMTMVIQPVSAVSNGRVEE